MTWQLRPFLHSLTGLRRRHRSGLTLVGTAIAIPIFLWFVGWLVIGDDLLAVRWGAFGAPWLALLALLAAGLLALGARSWLAVAALIVALLILSPVLPRLAPWRWSRMAEAGDLRVMTFNASDTNNDFEAIAALIAREHPDVVFLQQLSNLSALNSELRHLPRRPLYFSAPGRTFDTLILSRFPLSQVREFDQRTTAIAAIDGCQVRLWDYHAPHGQYSPADQKRYFEDAVRDLRGEPLPLLAGGDLNSTEFNAVQAGLRDELRDGFAQAGAGLGFTFPSRVRRFGFFGPLFRIDHIFFRKFNPVWATVVADNAGSDHFAVMVTFRRNGLCRANAQ